LPLYRLPQLIASPGKPTIVTEGERKADLAAEYFIGASSNFCRIATFMRIFHWRPAKPPALTLNVSV
jgi:hypothetical protein